VLSDTFHIVLKPGGSLPEENFSGRAIPSRTMVKVLFFLFLPAGLFLQSVNAQMEHGGWPLSASLSSKGNVPVITFPSVSRDMLTPDDGTTAKPLQFAVPFDGRWTPENTGIWTESGKYRIWRCGFHVPDALSVGIIFSHFELPEGASVFVYTAGYQDMKGAYTSENVLPSHFLALPHLRGSLCYVEYDVPPEQYKPNQLAIGRVAGGVIDVFGFQEKNNEQIAVSGACEVDINCPEGTLWQKEKRGVAKLLVNGTTLCTGSLVNNTEQNGKPYLLTAGHCIADQDDAWRTVFTFNYERSGCGSGTASSSQTISGSELISTVSGLDFSLVQLTIPPPPSYKPIYLGWDLDTTGVTSTVAIHHPAGDVKKISVDNDAPVYGNFGGGYDYMSHWQIIRWDKGATEGGSSGAPLFNQNHRIIGTLTGGDASCSNPVNDYFQRFDRCWDDYYPPANQLRAWLDPGHTGITHIDHFDPYNYTILSCDTLKNIAPGEKTGLKNLDFGGYASGHNWLGINGFAEKFVLPDSATLSGVFLFPLKLYDFSSADGSYITLFVSSGNLSQENRIYSEKILFTALKVNQLNFIPLWHYLPAKDTIYAGYEIYYGSKDTFAVAQTLERAPGSANSAYVRYRDIWTPYDTVFSVPASFYMGLQVCNLTWLKTTSEESTRPYAKVFPVPATGELNLVHNGLFSGDIVARVFDLSGRLVWTSSLNADGNMTRFSFGFLNNGIYVLKITTRNNSVYSFRFVIQK